MDYEQALTKAKEMVGTAKEIVIVTHRNPTLDSMGGSLALCLGLISLGKKATVICPDLVTVGLSSFVGVDKVAKEFGKKNFVISLDYEDGSIEKVSYNIEGKKFNLVVEHKPGYEPFTAEKANYSYQGVGADLIISVDTVNFAQLGHIYEGNKDLFAGKQIINIDLHNENVNYGHINLVDPGASSSTELVAEFLATLGVKLTTDIATNLLNAIYDATDNFRNPNVTSMAFEVASVCVKAGAVRFGVKAPDVTPQTTQTAEAPVKQSVIPPATTIAQQASVEQPQEVSSHPPVSQQQVQQSTSQNGSAQSSMRPNIQPMQQQAVTQPAQPPQPPPAEWLKPKIFKSSGTLV